MSHDDQPIDKEIAEIRRRYYEELSKQYNLTVQEIQTIHEDMLAWLSSIEPKFQMYAEISLPHRIENNKQTKNQNSVR